MLTWQVPLQQACADSLLWGWGTHHVSTGLDLKLPSFEVVVPGVVQPHALRSLVGVLGVISPPCYEWVRTDGRTRGADVTICTSN